MVLTVIFVPIVNLLNLLQYEDDISEYCLMRKSS